MCLTVYKIWINVGKKLHWLAYMCPTVVFIVAMAYWKTSNYMYSICKLVGVIHTFYVSLVTKKTVKFSLDEVKSWSLIIYPSVCLGNHFQESCLESYYSKVDFLKSRSKIQTWLSTKSHPWEAELSHNALWLNYIYSIMYSGKAY